MQNAFAKTFTKLPILGCVRTSRGMIIAVTDRLCEAEHKSARSLVGQHVATVWPQGRAWLALDRRALKSRSPLTQLEYSDGKWLASTRLPERGRVVWVAEDRSDSVRLAALRALTDLPRIPRAKEIPDAKAVAGFLVSDPASISTLGLNLEQLSGLLVRLSS